MSEQNLTESTVLFVGNVSYSLTDQALHDFFASHGEVVTAVVVRDEQQRSRGFGFVRFSDAQAVENVIEAVQGKELEGRPVRVSLADNDSRYLTLL